MDSLSAYVSPKERWVRKTYESGIRACTDYLSLIFRKDGVKCEMPTPPCSYQTAWHMLRAYQDEQRKKGEPIVHSFEDGINWYQRTYAEFIFDNDHTGPMIAVGDKHHSDFSYLSIGGFTNFRWRPGHGPKGGSNGSHS